MRRPMCAAPAASLNVTGGAEMDRLDFLLRPFARMLARLRRPTVERADRSAPPVREHAPASITRLVRLEDEAAAAHDIARVRLGMIGAIVLAGFAVTSGRAVQLAAFAPQDAPRAGAPVAAVSRAELVDRNGEKLATNLQFRNLYVDPAFVWDPEATARRIAEVLPDVDADALAARIRRGGRYVPVQRALTPRQVEAVYANGAEGVGFDDELVRVYPKGPVAAHVVGFAGTDLTGLAGAELALDSVLTDGARLPVPLSIDLTLQHAVESVLRERMSHYRASGAAAILMRVGTGEILAMASLPDFDPNRYGHAGEDQRMNRAVTGVYELGSVFKPLALAAAMEAGVADLDTVYDASRPLRRYGHTIRDYMGEGRPLTAREMIIHSSNIAAAQLGEAVGAERLADFYRALHLDEAAQVELVESAEPLFNASPGPMETMTMAYGHGLAVSPLALTAAYGAIANDGVYVAPTLRLVAPDELVAGEPVMSRGTAARIRGVLRETVTDEGVYGPTSADAAGLNVAGKTGTGLMPQGGVYSRERMATFVGIFPYDDPEYVLTVVLERPQQTAEMRGYSPTAGWTARPTAAEMLRRIGPVLGVEPRMTDPQARAVTVAQIFAPQIAARPGPEEPLPAGEVLSAADPALNVPPEDARE